MLASEVVVSGRTSLVLLVGGLATAIVAVWALFAKVILPVVDLIAKIREDFPILNEIAERFGESGGETITAEFRALAANDEISAANQQAILARLEAVSSKAEMIDDRLRQTRHDIIGEFAGLKTGPAGAATLVEAIERTAVSLQDVQTQLAEIADKPTTEHS